MKTYLQEFFSYNERANHKLLETINLLPEKQESMRLFGHLIAAQDKWMNRIRPHREDSSLHWYIEEVTPAKLAIEWKRSCEEWLSFLAVSNEQQLEKEIIFTRASDGKKIAVKIKDIILQINYHSIHHRAQINRLISAQGITPPATDYIFEVLREVPTRD